MYDTKNILSYHFEEIDHGAAATVTRYIPIPAGAKSGRVLDISALVTESFVGTTTPGAAQVGKAGSLLAYADLNLGTAGSPAQAGPYNGRIGAQAIHNAQWNNDTDDLDYLTVSFTPTVGGAVAGKAIYDIAVQWDFVNPAASS